MFHSVNDGPITSPSRRAFTLIELLIVIAIIAILSIVVILTLNPAQLLQQSRDSNRLSDMATLTEAIGVYQALGGTSLGSSSVVYISIPDPTATTTAGDQCQGLGLISLPATYTYHCAASSTDRAVDGTGWIPVNFAGLSAAPLGQLPVDPINTSSSREYYAYDTNGTQYEVTMAPESSKYQLGGSNDVISNDGGMLASVYEKGTGFGLEPLDYGDPTLVGWWPLNEGMGTVAYDDSGNNATGSLVDSPTWQSTGCKFANCISFNGLNPAVVLPNMSANLNTGSFTYCAWVNIPSSSYSASDYGDVLFAIQYAQTGLVASLSTTTVAIRGYVGGTANNEGSLSYNAWHQVCVVYAGQGNSARTLYADGILLGTMSSGSVTNASGTTEIGNNGYTCCSLTTNGLDYENDVRFYDRALSAAQIAAMYSGGK